MTLISTTNILSTKEKEIRIWKTNPDLTDRKTTGVRVVECKRNLQIIEESNTPFQGLHG